MKRITIVLMLLMASVAFGADENTFKDGIVTYKLSELYKGEGIDFSDDKLTGILSIDEKLSVFNATTSAELLGVISDETGSGLAVFGTAPTIADPTISDPTISGTITNATDISFSLKTVIKTIDLDDDASTDDFQFDDDQINVTEQSVDLGALVPAYAEVVSVMVRCFETVTGSNSMGIDIGTATGGDQYISTADTDTAADINSTAVAGSPVVAATAAAQKVWINATPGANWSTLDAGRWAIMVTYIDYGAAYTDK
jgi:hypothetical protein